MEVVNSGKERVAIEELQDMGRCRGLRANITTQIAFVYLFLPFLAHSVHCFCPPLAALDGQGIRWGLRYKPSACPRLVGWAPRGCPLRRASPERRQLACGSGEEGRSLVTLRKIESWESIEIDQRQKNFTRAVWTCGPAAQIFFTYDQEECHYIHEGKARVALVSRTSSGIDTAHQFLELSAGDCVVTPAGARVRWDIVAPIKKQTSCREPFRMVSQGWILAPPLSFSASRVRFDLEPNTRTLRRAAMQHTSALMDTLQESRKGLLQDGSAPSRHRYS